MSTGQILREVFEKRVQEQIELINKLANDNNEIDYALVTDALDKITGYYYGKSNKY